MAKESENSLVQKVRKGNVRSLARLISLIEDESPEVESYIEQLYPHTGNAYVLGVTGSPGAGKSTLVDALAVGFAEQGKKVAILAIDPSSPFTGGALLGDRIRMGLAESRPDIYIRSMATRGAVGGLAPRTTEAIFACDAAGFDIIILETVGVGQAEIEVVRTADSVVLVLVPGMGDSVQALKAGIIEIADVFAINKADQTGADLVKKDLVQVMSLADSKDRSPAIVKTVASKNEGIDKLLEEIEKFRSWAESSGYLERRKESLLRQTLENQISRECLRRVREQADSAARFAQALKNLSERKQSPSQAARELVSKVFS